MVKLADTHGSGPCARKGVEVQVLFPAPFRQFFEAPVAQCAGALFVLRSFLSGACVPLLIARPWQVLIATLAHFARNAQFTESTILTRQYYGRSQIVLA